MRNQKAPMFQPKTTALVRLNFFSRREMAELPKLLLSDETILAVVSGVYTAGTAILCVTSKRMLLVDKKIIRLNFEDVRFDSIREVNFSQQAIMASIRFFYAGREMEFRSWHKTELRELAQLVQEKMFEVREKQDTRQDVPVNQLPMQPVIQVPVEPSVPLATTIARDSTSQRENYLNDRLERWRHADRFVDKLTMSVKTGRQILRLETQGK